MSPVEAFQIGDIVETWGLHTAVVVGTPATANGMVADDSTSILDDYYYICLILASGPDTTAWQEMQTTAEPASQMVLIERPQ